MKITIYGAQLCSKCKVAEALLKAKYHEDVKKVVATDEMTNIFADHGFSSYPIVEVKLTDDGEAKYFSGTKVVDDVINYVEDSNDSTGNDVGGCGEGGCSF